MPWEVTCELVRSIRRAVVLFVGATLVSGCSNLPLTSSPTEPSTQSSSRAASTRPGAAPSGPIAFGPCTGRFVLGEGGLPPERLGQLDFRCGVLTVPLDHRRPAGPQLEMAVVRVRSAGQHQPIGSLVLNPGGPGQPGLESMPYWAASFPQELLDRFDLVSFDPRGTGSSAPIDCPDLPDEIDAAAQPDLTTAAGFAEATARQRRYAATCVVELGPRAPFFTTDSTARDLDLLRAALGDDRLDYVGFSYGAKLGRHYATLFPDRVGHLVLDAPSDPTAPWDAIVFSQVAGFEDLFSRYADQCPTRPTCAPIGDPAGFLDRLVDRARSERIPSGRPAEDPPATWDVVLGAVTTMLYSRAEWPHLDEVLIEADRGDSGGLYDVRDWFSRKDSRQNEPYDPPDAQFVVNCNEMPPGPPEQQLRAQASRLASRYPRFGALGTGWLLGCTSWTAPRHPLRAPHAPSAPPLLVIGTEHDPATPYSGAVEFTKSLGGKATLLTWAGDGHTAFGQSPCIGEHVVRYLVDGTLPATGTTCPAAESFGDGLSG